MRLPRGLTPHSVVVKRLAGEGPNGPVWDDPTQVDHVYVEDVQEIVVDSAGAEIVSRGKVFFNLDDTPTEGSLITVWAGTARATEATAFKVTVFDHPGAASHAVAYLK